MRVMMRSFVLTSLLLCVLGESAPECQGEEGSCAVDQGTATGANKGLTLLQGVRRAGKMEADAADCAEDNEDPNWPRRNRGCCPGFQKCGPYQFRWGWSFRCFSGQCRTPTDECGCLLGQTGWSTTIGACRASSTTSEREAKQCEEAGIGGITTTEAPGTTIGGGMSDTTTQDGEVTTTADTGSSTTGGSSGETPTKLRIMSWNVYFGNGKIDAMGNMLKEWDVDIANLQETNNRLERIADEAGMVSANTWRQPHDWCGYNFHKTDWSHASSVEVEVPGSRGVCGAMMQKGNAKFCVWGLHPVQRGNNVKWAKESMDLAADKMKECAETHNAPSIFLGDFNTADWRGAKGHLEYVNWSKIVGDGTCWPAFPPHNKDTIVIVLAQERRKTFIGRFFGWTVDGRGRLEQQSFAAFELNLWVSRLSLACWRLSFLALPISRQEQAHFLEALEVLDQPEYEQFDDFLEMVIEFGYVTLFASAFPLAGVMSIVSNLIEMKSDMFKLALVYQRPMPHRASNIGIWRTLLHVIVAFSVATNVMIFTMSEQFASWAPGLYREASIHDVHGGLLAQATDATTGTADLVMRQGSGRYVIFFATVLEHVVGLAVLIVMAAIPREPEWVYSEILRTKRFKAFRAKEAAFGWLNEQKPPGETEQRSRTWNINTDDEVEWMHVQLQDCADLDETDDTQLEALNVVLLLKDARLRRKEDELLSRRDRLGLLSFMHQWSSAILSESALPVEQVMKFSESMLAIKLQYQQDQPVSHLKGHGTLSPAEEARLADLRQQRAALKEPVHIFDDPLFAKAMDQNEKAFQKQDAIFIGSKRALAKKSKKPQRYYRKIGLGFATPKEAISGNFVDKKCPFTGNVSIRGAILKGMCISTKMKRTIIIRRNYLHYIKKFNRFEKRHSNLAVHCSPAFEPKEGDIITAGQCRPLAKTVRFNVVKVDKNQIFGSARKQLLAVMQIP
ncbi:rps11 [Symbiodinium sp. KB8]|nr:rps11 [Symbiodinium sp. KB8]